VCVEVLGVSCANLEMSSPEKVVVEVRCKKNGSKTLENSSYVNLQSTGEKAKVGGLLGLGGRIRDI
jgi:hypothetical protein